MGNSNDFCDWIQAMTKKLFSRAMLPNIGVVNHMRLLSTWSVDSLNLDEL